MTNDLTAALSELTTALEHLQAARRATLQAEPALTDARRARCVELTDKLTDVIAWCWRLSVVVEGDCRTEQAELRP
jgi:hypothetical protein